MWRTAQAGLRRQNLAFRSRTRSLPSRPSSHKPSALANLTKPPFASFVACLPGIEPILSSEIKSILSGWGGSRSSEHPKRVRPVRGGCHVRIASIEELYRLHLHVGTASHIYLRFNDDDAEDIPALFTARGFPELERKFETLIRNYACVFDVPDGNGSIIEEHDLAWKLKVHVTTAKSKLMHTRAVEERARRVLGGVLRVNFSDGRDKDEVEIRAEEKPIVRLFVRIERDRVQLSLDTSSTPLHRRGYRMYPHKAPLREDLAFALLKAAGLRPIGEQGAVRLLDPCCGSGTIAIEGAAILAGLPPGRLRPPPLLGTNLCDVRMWDDIREISQAKSNTTKFVIANDIEDCGARSNAQLAGVADLIRFEKGPFRKLDVKTNGNIIIDEPLWVVTNPPFVGKRLAGNRAKKTSGNIYRELARLINARQAQFALIGNNLRMLRQSGLPMKVAFSTQHGGLSVVAVTSKDLT